MNETNITDNRKTRRNIRTPTCSEAVKRRAGKDIVEKITNLEEIKVSLLRDSLTQACQTSPLVLCCDSSICKNSSDQLGLNEQSLGNALSSQDDELLRSLRIFRMKNWSIIILSCVMILELVLLLFGYCIQPKSKGALRR